MAWKSSFRQNSDNILAHSSHFRPGISHVVADVEAPVGEKWEHLKSGGKQWQATPKNLPRIQRTRAIPVTWLNSGLCPDRPKGWIPIIIIIIKDDSETQRTAVDARKTNWRKRKRNEENGRKRNKCRKCWWRLLKNQFLSLELCIIKLDLHIITVQGYS